MNDHATGFEIARGEYPNAGRCRKCLARGKLSGVGLISIPAQSTSPARHAGMSAEKKRSRVVGVIVGERQALGLRSGAAGKGVPRLRIASRPGGAVSPPSPASPSLWRVGERVAVERPAAIRRTLRPMSEARTARRHYPLCNFLRLPPGGGKEGGGVSCWDTPPFWYPCNFLQCRV